MSIGSTLPPQAYTREILAVAFNWLQNQPESVRKQAQTPDALVALYLRAQRFGTTGADSDVNPGHAFTSDLRELAEGLKPIDEARAGAYEESRSGTVTMSTEYTQRAVRFSAPSPTPPTFAANAIPTTAERAPFPSPAAPSAGHASAATVTGAHVSNGASLHPQYAPGSGAGPSVSPAVGGAASSPSCHPDDPPPIRLTPASLKMTSEIRERMNLSSDVEAANMMIAVAYKTLQNLLR